MEQMFAKMESIDPQFRLFITCLPHKDFPLGLLQMSTKVTNEPPMGLKAGLISASRRVEAPSRHRRDSCPSDDDVGGFFFYFEAVRTDLTEMLRAGPWRRRASRP